ncbi:hypothetical protein Arad_8006 [Rhizobium rhizogenes K84]|uniref:Uncharacterized protein n=1 Tax=Rhizobium rhizogenes (strain K84 / ATCC BAA-868) TaxID=311403 RepID=B9JHI9_RHIR8|nr:hypothetical protein Arad_8006 [Rhizobium rhizogenes K84]
MLGFSKPVISAPKVCTRAAESLTLGGGLEADIVGYFIVWQRSECIRDDSSR